MKTRNLDLASVLMCHGFNCKVRRLHETQAEYTFEDNHEVERVVEQFLKGDMKVNVTTFLYHRLALKIECKKQVFIVPKTVRINMVGDPTEMRPGQPYWFVTGGTVFNQLWGNTDVHLDRLKIGNVFLSKAEAQEALKNKFRA